MLLRSATFFVLVLLSVPSNAQTAASLRQGLVIVQNDRGKIIDRSFYKDDTLHGESVKLRKNGKPFIRCWYVKGKLDGDWVYYDSRGRIAIYAHFVDGVRDIFRSYWRNGNERLTAHFLDGLIDGEMKTFYKSGRVESILLCRRGGYLSAFRKYDKKGNLIMMMWPIDTTRDRFTSVEYFDRNGKAKKSQAINERPLAYYLFGPEVHRSGPLKGGEN